MAFAEPTDLATRLGRTFTEPEALQVSALLDDATAHLQTIIGAQVSPPAEVTVRHLVSQGQWIDPPAYPATVTAVEINGEPFEVDPYETADGRIYSPAAWFTHSPELGFAETYGPGVLAVDITYEVGYADAPADLLAWACVLASQALANVTDLGAMGAGGVTSVAIDDYRKAWDPASTPGGGIPDRVAERLRAAYGTTAYVTSSL